ncbi:AGAP002174-PA-like protein [Anopheles sinensis]|uniref:AGAP002174-PA-like protein n=1 Tax=Anopheles sinensis TaxID=74873 RepID=A0A084VRF4_ANOSI|nr:AGAP002174-PA-like protein [Anopheles sinensis]
MVKHTGGKNTSGTPARLKANTKHSDTRSNDDSCDVSPSQGADYSPMISLTQDNAIHAINGVSWKWNSPQRFHGQIPLKAGDVGKKTQKPLQKPLKHSEPPPVEAPKEATGFNKFISKLNLIMGKENVGENVGSAEPASLSVERSDTTEEQYFHTAEQSPCEGQVHSEDSAEDIFEHHCIDVVEDEYGFIVGVEKRRISESSDTFDSQPFDDELDDSKLDRILIEASQTVEQKLNNPSLPPPTVIPNRRQSNTNVPFEMNDSDMDGFLLQASLMVEEKLSDSSQDSASHKPAANVPRNSAVAIPPSHSNHPPVEVERKQAQPSADASKQGAVGGTSEIAMSEDELKALLEKKRQEALIRLQNNRLKRAMKGTNSNG